MWERVKSRPAISGMLILLIGLVLAVGGGRLLIAGGSAYYLLAGIGYIVTGGLLVAGLRTALAVNALIFFATLVWSFYEVGLQGWKLLPRLDMPTVITLYLMMPWVWKKLGRRGPQAKRPVKQAEKSHLALAVIPGVTALIVSLAGVSAATYAYWQVDMPTSPSAAVDSSFPDATGVASKGLDNDDWPHYGRTPAGDRYSPLKQITPQNVSQLKEVWRYRTGDLDNEGPGHPTFAYESTPLKVNDTLYSCTPHAWVAAVDAVTGQQRWKFKPNVDTSHNYFINCRGVSYYRVPGQPDQKKVSAPVQQHDNAVLNGPHLSPHTSALVQNAAPNEPQQQNTCRARIIAPVLDGRMVELDARTGEVCQEFGNHGYVDLTQGMGEVAPGLYTQTSPPLVVDNKIFVGGNVYDNKSVGEPSGVVRAFDAQTGKLVWSWDMGRKNPTEPLAPGEVYTPGTPNAWGVFTADPALGLVYVPTGIATPDYWGGTRRSFDEKYGSSVIALDIDTGEVRWSFQLTHHDIWDFDTPIGPSLVDLPDGNGGTIPALMQTTKRGELFLLNRKTGEPIADVEEKPVPQGAAKGDYVSETQPFSTGMPSIGPKQLTATDIWGATPIDQLWCRIEYNQMRYEGAFTPPSTQGSILYPAFDGVTDWYGATVDPARKMMVVTANYLPFTGKLIPRDEAVESGQVPDWNGRGEPPEAKGKVVPQYGLPYAIALEPWLNMLGVPCNAPPWGTISAIDLNDKEVMWSRQLGTTRDMGPFGLHYNAPLATGIFSLGSGITTASGLVFIAGTVDQNLRAFDEKTGKLLWKYHLPAGAQSTPITYRGKDGRQYVAITAGGHEALGTRQGDYLIAFALPEDNSLNTDR